MQSHQVHHPSVVIIVDEVRTSSLDYFGCLSGYQWEGNLRGKLLRAGFEPDAVRVVTLDSVLNGTNLLGDEVLVGLGEKVLRALTDKRGIDKWVLSPLQTHDGRRYIPAHDLGRLQKQYELNLYLELALRRAKEFSTNPPTPTPERFRLNPSLEETLAILRFLHTEHQGPIAVDVETGYGQINTVGFAWSPSDAIAINTLPDRCSDVCFHELWLQIAAVLEGPHPKVFQNFIYDTSYFSAYGIHTENITHDTMHAMKVLWPELDQNLGNVGRIYTRRPYWKDDGKVESEEGKKKDWGNVRDWNRHYIYNCRDSTGTLEASMHQIDDLKGRGLYDFFNSYLQRLIDPVREMCAVGMPVCAETREVLQRETEARVEELTREFQAAAGEVNPRSPKQVLNWLRESGVKLPKKYDKTTGTYKESSDANSIKKVRLKQDRPGLKELQEIKGLDKALSSYIAFDPRGDGRLTYSLNLTGTETLRWSGGKDAWGRGINIQTIPRDGDGPSIKSMFVAPEGFTFLEVDLRQAESRFVAYDSADKTLIDMLESGADVHSHVGHAILRQMGKDSAAIGKDEFKQTWRQLGKKAGHGLNYGMKAGVFQETVFNELDLVITKKDAELITQAYFGLFPGIPRWHAWVRNELYTKRKLTTPFGWERYFYGRPDDALKEGLAFRPQSTIPYLTNCLMLHLTDLRRHESLKFRLIYQCHDSLVMLVPEGEEEPVARVCLDTRAGHPVIDLPGGRMYIPREVKVGKCLATAKEIAL